MNRSSAYLLAVAEALDGGFSAAAVADHKPDRWAEWLVLTLPDCLCYDHHAEDIQETRVLRFCLAAAIARSEGD